MWIVAIVCVVGFFLWQSNKRRAQRFVRSVFFLEILNSGAGVDRANGQVARLFTKHSTADEDNAAIRDAMDKANRLTDGKQLPWIHEAREKGFTIDSGDSRFDMAQALQSQSLANPDQKFSEHTTEGEHTLTAGTQYPHTLSRLTEACHAALERIEASKSKLVPAIKAVFRIAISWALRGALAGIILGFALPRTGMTNSFEDWFIFALIAYWGAIAGLIIGAVYRTLSWLYTD